MIAHRDPRIFGLRGSVVPIAFVLARFDRRGLDCSFAVSIDIGNLASFSNEPVVVVSISEHELVDIRFVEFCGEGVLASMVVGIEGAVSVSSIKRITSGMPS